MRYLTSWFLIDFTSVIPLDLMFNNGSINKITRFSRIGKLSQLVRMTKIVKIIRIIKINNKLAKSLADILKIGAGTERLIYLLLIFLTLQHVTACLWYSVIPTYCLFRIFIGRYDD